MASKIGIWNLALSHLGIGKEVASATEKSQEAQACSRFWDQAVEQTHRDHDYPFSTRFIELQLVEADPNTEWDYSYRYPLNCMKFRRILGDSRNPSADTRVVYRVAGDNSGSLIFTDKPDAVGEFTVLVTNESLYPPDFVMALSFRLAAYIAPRVTGGDPFKMGDRAMRMYLTEIDIAKANAGNEQQSDLEPDAEIIRGRV